jgi:microcystin-dependent protein
MGTPYLSEIRVFSFGFPPKGWAQCNGQLLPINQNQALFALLGTMYGGDGRVTFALPNLQGRVPVSFSATYPQGAFGGEEAHALTLSEIPPHTHQANANPTAADQGLPTGNLWATQTANAYAATADSALASQAIGNTGVSQPHENRPPFLWLTFVSRSRASSPRATDFPLCLTNLSARFAFSGVTSPPSAGRFATAH